MKEEIQLLRRSSYDKNFQIKSSNLQYLKSLMINLSMDPNAKYLKSLMIRITNKRKASPDEMEHTNES